MTHRRKQLGMTPGQDHALRTVERAAGRADNPPAWRRVDPATLTPDAHAFRLASHLHKQRLLAGDPWEVPSVHTVLPLGLWYRSPGAAAKTIADRAEYEEIRREVEHQFAAMEALA